MLKALFYIIFCLVSFTKVDSCNYVYPNISEVVIGVKIDPLPMGYVSRSVTSKNIRIHLEYSDSFNSYVGASELKMDVIEPARMDLESMIVVKNPISGMLRVDRQCVKDGRYINTKGESWCIYGCTATSTCLNINIPDKYLKKCKLGTPRGIKSTSGSDGVGEPNVDIVLLVSYLSCDAGFLAYATSCYQESTLDRPIMGVLNLCAGKIKAGINIRENRMTLKHEIIHALGFAAEKYAYYRYQDGTPIVPRDEYGRPNLGISKDGFYKWNDKIAVTVNRSRSSVSMNYTKQFTAFTLPNVVAVAREHFNCPSITEVDLEDAGGSGSAMSHFDELLLYNECMTPVSNGWMQRLSKFTLALLQDTGWYDVDYSKADEFLYGKAAGCTMPLKGCYAYMEEQRTNNKPIDPFCDTAYGQILQCNPTRQYYEYCGIVEDTSRSANYSYFKTLKGFTNYNPNHYGGNSIFTEYCPMKEVPFDTNDGLNSDCTDVGNQERSNQYTPIQSGYGSNSLCFDTSLTNQPIYGATCLNYIYTGDNLEYNVCVNGAPLKCTANGTVQFQNSFQITATVTCPQPSLLAKTNPPFMCGQTEIAVSSIQTVGSTSKKRALRHYQLMDLIWITFLCSSLYQ